MSFDSLLHSLIKIPGIHSCKINSDSPRAISQCVTDPLLNLIDCQVVGSVPQVTVRDLVVAPKRQQRLKQVDQRHQNH